MESEALKTVIERIKYMEKCFEFLQNCPREMRMGADVENQLQQLREYFESADWLQDYELDEQGVLPKDLKRGVLSQDGVYNFLEEWKC